MKEIKLEDIKETWDYIEPFYGAQIRTKRDQVYHHGIFIDKENVIAFGDGIFSNASKCDFVERFTLKTFLSGGILEVRTYSKKEKKQLNSSDEIVRKAEMSLGMKGYDFIHNNCEHFSNECAFNHKYSTQVDHIRAELRKMIK